MITVTIFNVIAVLYSYLSRYKRSELWLKITFFIIFLLIALRYNYGNDYPAYMKGFYKINDLSQIDYFDQSWHFEPGWIFLCRLFEPFGFSALVAFVSLLFCFVFYKIISKFVQPKYHWFSVFFIVFNPNIMLIQLSAMRQSVAISMFLLSIICLSRRYLGLSILCILFGALFHYSCLVFLPLCLLLWIIPDFNFNKFILVTISVAYCSLFFLVPYISDFVNYFVLKNVPGYSVYLEHEGTGRFGLGSLFYSFLLPVILYYANRLDTYEKRFFTKVGLFNFLLIPIVLTIPMISRYTFYFAPLLCLVFPIVLAEILQPKVRACIFSLIVVLTVYSYFQFLNSETYSTAFGTYQTIFE